MSSKKLAGIILFLAMSLLALSSSAWATQYYVSNGGSDSNGGTSQSRPWATFYHFNYTTLQPGDSIFLQCGSTWRNPGGSSANNYILNLAGSGTAGNPITVTSYGSGKQPLIIGQGDTPTSPTNICISAYGNSYLNISNIHCKNAWRGIQIANPNSIPAAGIHINNCTIENISYYGLYGNTQTYTAAPGVIFSGAPGVNPAFTAPMVTNCIFSNCACSVSMTAATNPIVADCSCTGSIWIAILYYLIDGGTISNCIVTNNGGYVDKGCAALGIQGCNNVTVRNSIIQNEINGGGYDGEAIDFENNNTSCTVTDCYIYACDGPGISFGNTDGPSTGIRIENTMIYNNNFNAWWSPSILPANNISSGMDSNAASFTNCCINPNSLTLINFYPLGQWTLDGVHQNAYQDGWTPLWSNLGTTGAIANGGNGALWALQVTSQTAATLQWNGKLTGPCMNTIAQPGSSGMSSLGVGRNGTVWGVESDGTVWAYQGQQAWSSIAGPAPDNSLDSISVGCAANIWGLRGSAVYHWNDGSWDSFAQPLAQLSADVVAPIVTGVDGSNRIWRYDGHTWFQLSGPPLRQISAPGGGLAAGVDTAGHVWYTLNLTAANPNWIKTSGGTMRQVSISPDLGLWGVADDGSGSVWRFGEPLQPAQPYLSPSTGITLPLAPASTVTTAGLSLGNLGLPGSQLTWTTYTLTANSGFTLLNPPVTWPKKFSAGELTSLTLAVSPVRVGDQSSTLALVVFDGRATQTLEVSLSSHTPIPPSLTSFSFSDPYSSNGLDSHWLPLNSTPSLVQETKTIPSNDGRVMMFSSAAPGVSNGLVVQGTEVWTTGTLLANVTASVSILPFAAPSGLSEQGVIIGAAPSFSFASSDYYYTAFLLYYQGSWHIRGTCNCPPVQQPFPGWAFIDVAAPGNPMDGNYHTLTLKIVPQGVSPSINTMTVLWDDQVVGTCNNDSRIVGLPVGRVGVFGITWATGEPFRFDNFQATWDNTPTINVPVTLSSFTIE